MKKSHLIPLLLFGASLISHIAHAADVQVAELKESVQFNAKRLDFKLGDAPAFIIIPAKPTESAKHPWLWYAPTFIGRHPDPSHTWMFEQLLAEGFFIGGIEVGESYGSPTGRAIYQTYYEHVTTTYGLSPRACLMPQSRGGLMLYNWAAEHPESVACIAGIYTVCNIESYPGIEKAAPAYGMTADELRANLTDHNPLSRLESLAKVKVPIYHVHGDSDTVVPIEANAGELVNRYLALGGPGRIKIVPGKGHQVCDEFFKDADLVAFILTTTK